MHLNIHTKTEAKKWSALCFLLPFISSLSLREYKTTSFQNVAKEGRDSVCEMTFTTDHCWWRQEEEAALWVCGVFLFRATHRHVKTWHQKTTASLFYEPTRYQPRCFVSQPHRGWLAFCEKQTISQKPQVIMGVRMTFGRHCICWMILGTNKTVRVPRNWRFWGWGCEKRSKGESTSKNRNRLGRC